MAQTLVPHAVDKSLISFVPNMRFSLTNRRITFASLLSGRNSTLVSSVLIHFHIILFHIQDARAVWKWQKKWIFIAWCGFFLFRAKKSFSRIFFSAVCGSNVFCEITKCNNNSQLIYVWLICLWTPFDSILRANSIRYSFQSLSLPDSKGQSKCRDE